MLHILFYVRSNKKYSVNEADMLNRISIVIPTLNCGKYIQTAVNSVLNQPYPDKELFVMDAGSSDDTVSILKQYGNRIVWVSEKDKGQWHGIQKGLDRATGDIFAYLNADDWYEPDIFPEIVAAFNSDPFIELVYGQCNIIYSDRVELFKSEPTITRGMLLRLGNNTSQPTTFFRAKTLRDSGGIVRAHYMMEYDMNLRALFRGKAFYIARPLANFLVHEGQKSGTDAYRRIEKEVACMGLRHSRNPLCPVFLSYVKKYYILPMRNAVSRILKLKTCA